MASELPSDLPVPVDDGAAEGLEGRALPDVALASTGGGVVDLRAAAEGTLVAYVYPSTAVPGQALPDGWDEIPGARGCTPENCAFRDHEREILEAGAAAVVGISAQAAAEQREFAARERIPYPLLSDPDLRLAEALGLPTFEVPGKRLYRRLTLIADAGRIVKVFYPIFPPDRHPEEVVGWLRGRG